MSDAKNADLTGTQKAAVILMNLDQDRAALVLKEMPEAKAEELAHEIVKLRRVEHGVIESTIAEFHEMIVTGRSPVHGGRDFAESLLEKSFGSERAAGVLNRVASTMAGKSFEFLDDAEPQQIISLLDGEMPQTQALVLAHLRPSHASAVLSGLPEEDRAEVAQCIATMTAATPETIAATAASFRSRSAAVMAPRRAVEVVGGVQPLVDIINRAPVATEKSVLEGLDILDPVLAEEVRSRMLTFADIVKLDARDIQVVLRSVSNNTLAIAIRGATPTVVEAITANISVRNKELLDDDPKL